MSIVKKQVDYCEEVASLLHIVLAVGKDLVEKKIPADVVPQIIGALTGLASLGEELKNTVAMETTVALVLVEAKEAFLPSKTA